MSKIITASIPICHTEVVVRDDGIVAAFNLVETNIVDNKDQFRFHYYYTVILTEPSTKKRLRFTGYTKQYLDDACSYVRRYAKNRKFK